jgi:hypothetical protein
MQNADTVYAPKPWASNEERLVSEALAANTTPGSVLQSAVRPPLPRVVLFPPRYGYRTEPYGIRDVLDVDNAFPTARVDYSGSSSGYSGTSTPSLGNW